MVGTHHLMVLTLNFNAFVFHCLDLITDVSVVSLAQRQPPFLDEDLPERGEDEESNDSQASESGLHAQSLKFMENCGNAILLLRSIIVFPSSNIVCDMRGV